MHVVIGFYRTPLPNRALPWNPHLFYIGSFHRDDLLEQGSEQGALLKKTLIELGEVIVSENKLFLF